MPNSVIAEDLVVDGHINSDKGSIEIRGKVIGNVTALSVVIRSGGSVKGIVSAKEVVIEGKHNGVLKCDDLMLSSSAQVEADVSAYIIVVESGAGINGAMHISGKA